MYIGEFIKNYRELHNLSMQDFSNLTGLSKAYIGMLEKIYNPKTNQPISPSIDKLNQIAIGVGLTLDDLLKQLDSDQPVTVNTKKNDEYYTYPEAAEFAEMIRNKPGARALFSASKDLTKEQMEDTVNYIEFLKSRNKG
ncbi:helix-turn-helix domain-containing protein [Veillonella sp. R32]|uniref:helix-turn-helix domain-containing protein n=1 Tax=Veillonella sp. R32 TaxID=2021312 RepID=UPI00138A0B7C|nr:helix-turn-helix transcriptional regulator [Veillonella sp. R32]KAF1680467.1 hypothetical protein VER_08505 [Veillonella sp. R32]